MTDHQPHTPHIAEVCSAYVQYHLFNSCGEDDFEETEKSFYRMIARIEAAAEQRGKEQGWDEGYEASDHEAYYYSTHGNTENPYRADQMEGNDE